MDTEKNHNLKTKILKKLGQLAWLSIVVFVLSLVAGATIHIFAAFTEPTAAPSASDQDFAENILGANNADNEYDSSSVTASSTGSLIERLQYVQDNLSASGYTYGDEDPDYVLGTASGPGKALKNTWNGSATGNNFPQSVGGVEDYNDNNSIPSDAYGSSTPWTQCVAGNNYCGTDDDTACGDDSCWRDDSTGLIWSDWLDSGTTHDWFWANNCKDDSLIGDGTCNLDGEAACECVRPPSGYETGCASTTYTDGNWRLPYQKELMQAYINGSWDKLPDTSNLVYWAATTLSGFTHYAWYVGLYAGDVNPNMKTNTVVSRCVR